MADETQDQCLIGAILECSPPFTKRIESRFTDSFLNIQDNVCCGSVSHCCEWTPGGITLVVFLVLLLLALIGLCVKCCCLRPDGCCKCNRNTLQRLRESIL